MTGRTAAIRNLILEIDLYLARFEGSGVADVRAGIRAALARGVSDGLANAEPRCGFLDEALAAARGADNLVRAIEDARPHLGWIAYDLYPRSEIGPRFPEAHAFASIIGEGAPVHAEDFDLGLFLIAPRTLYRDHHHAAPELYAPITGPHRWRFGTHSAWIEMPAHDPVWNEPWATHAILAGDTPFLCIFGWTKDVNSPARVVCATDWTMIEAGL